MSVSTYLSDPPNILIPALLIKPQIPIQPKPHIIPIEPVRGQAQVQQMLFERRRDGRFAGRGEAGEPQREAALFAELGALGARERGVPCYVSGGGS